MQNWNTLGFHHQQYAFCYIQCFGYKPGHQKLEKGRRHLRFVLQGIFQNCPNLKSQIMRKSSRGKKERAKRVKC
jgi:hypothetical protein